MNRSKSKPLLWAFVVVVASAAVAGAYAMVMSRSQALLLARHPLPASTVVALTTPQAIAEGEHLVTVTACAGCHGADLTGGPLQVAGTQDYTSNLTRALRRLSDADIDRALRRGLRPDGSSELVMPSQAYATFTDAEMAAIIGYLRGLPPTGTEPPKPTPGLLLRASLLMGGLRTADDKVARARPPVDAGAAFESGRHLAAVACGRCHGTDLGGIREAGSDMTVRGYYSRARFHTLLRKGDVIGEGNTKLMSDTAQASFSHFTDAEIDALYDYLYARDRILAARRAAPTPR